MLTKQNIHRALLNMFDFITILIYLYKTINYLTPPFDIL